LGQAGNAMSVNVIESLGQSLATFIFQLELDGTYNPKMIPDSQMMIPK
jgi:hypothetical protein